MAQGKYNFSKKKNFRKRKSKYTELEKMAYKMGQINRGLKNDSLVKESYDRGFNPEKKEKPIKKSLLGD